MKNRRTLTISKVGTTEAKPGVKAPDESPHELRKVVALACHEVRFPEVETIPDFEAERYELSFELQDGVTIRRSAQ